MCGIAGFLADEHPRTGEAVLGRMTAILAHRGPDGSGLWSDSPVFLGHRRLSIVDLAAGQQPMHAGGLTVVYNGEIFNHAALRPELESAGRVYATRCDTEAILHAYAVHGKDCVRLFRGMFAFALWDRETRTLFCARDRLGIKPFYYYSDGAVFVFASEIKALFEHPSVPCELAAEALAESLSFGYTSGSRTLYRGIRRLEPGHTLTCAWVDGRPRIRIGRYWDVPDGPSEGRDTQDLIQECRRRLEETVRMRLMSDVPLGMFLSGGIDSSAIAALMARDVDGPVKTFSVGYAEAEYSELEYARETAAALGTEHHEVAVGMDEFFNALPSLVWHEDEPLAWPSSVSLYFVSRLASRHVKVVLTGEGSDEMFGGYTRYRLNLLNQRSAAAMRFVPPALRAALRRWVNGSRLLSADLRRKLAHTAAGREDSIESLYLDNFYGAFDPDGLRRLAPGMRESPYEGFLAHWNARSGSTLLARMLYADQKTYLGELLMKQDQMSMATSIESRVPFLDHPFVEFAARVPDRLKIRRGVGKSILREAVRDLVPPAVLTRRKLGFPTPVRRWLLGSRAEPLYALLRERGGLLAEVCDPAEIDRLVSLHRAGTEDATDRLWRLLNLQIWGDLFLTGRKDRWSNGVMAAAAR
ncbi:MAG: asparagine synthase (glutamine-hydrolyzing) [Bryobacterales bacterium]|nr:asparagine synthase (glutamine-hydrolyzing) [Bryobacterales bacterium]